jgi:hypothetical protein
MKRSTESRRAKAPTKTTEINTHASPRRTDMSTERQPTRRRDIKDALRYLEGLQLELAAGLNPYKGFVAHTYLDEKYGYLQREMERISKTTGMVEPPQKSVFKVGYKFVCEGSILVEADSRDDAEAAMRRNYDSLNIKLGGLDEGTLDCTDIEMAIEAVQA